MTAAGQRAGAPASPCRGIDPWRGAGRRGCSALVFGWARVHSIRLTTHASARVRSTCAKARRQLRIVFVCPPLVPTDGVVSDPGLYGAETDPTGDFYLLTFNNGDNVGHIHWIVGAGRVQTVHRKLFDRRNWAVQGPRVRLLGERRYGPWTISFYRFPPYPSGGELGGHDLALVHVGDTTYFASVHGRSHHDADAAMLLAILLTAGAQPIGKR